MLFLHDIHFEDISCFNTLKLEDLKRSADIQIMLNRSSSTMDYNETYFVLTYMGAAPILVKWPKTI